MLIIFFSSRRRHTRCALVTGVQTCALPISRNCRLGHDDHDLCCGRNDMKKATKGPSIKTAQALLAKHECPVPFHEVRTRFLGNIATPAISASPLQIIKDLWGGELPPFDSIEEVNEQIGRASCRERGV